MPAWPPMATFLVHAPACEPPIAARAAAVMAAPVASRDWNNIYIFTLRLLARPLTQ